jgi:hypothetical protein
MQVVWLAIPRLGNNKFEGLLTNDELSSNLF